MLLRHPGNAYCQKNTEHQNVPPAAQNADIDAHPHITSCHLEHQPSSCGSCGTSVSAMACKLIGGKHRKYALSAYINDFDAHCFCGEEQVAVMGDQRKIPVDLHFLYCRHKAGGASNQQTVWWNFAVSDSSLG